MTAAEAQAALGRLNEWSRSPATARQAIDALPALRRDLPTAGDSVEADYYGLYARITLGAGLELCGDLRALHRRASRAGHFADAVATLLQSCPPDGA
jgi:hypothetical protein